MSILINLMDSPEFTDCSSTCMNVVDLAFHVDPPGPRGQRSALPGITIILILLIDLAFLIIIIL